MDGMDGESGTLAGLHDALSRALREATPATGWHLRAVAHSLQRAQLPEHWTTPGATTAWLEQLHAGHITRDQKPTPPSTAVTYSYAYNKLLRHAGSNTRLPGGHTDRRTPLTTQQRNKALADAEAMARAHPPGSLPYMTAARGTAALACIADTGIHVGALNDATLRDLDIAAATLTLTDKRPGMQRHPAPHPYPLTKFTMRALYRWLEVRQTLTTNRTGVNAIWVTIIGGSYTDDTGNHRRPAGLPIRDPQTLVNGYRSTLAQLDGTPGHGTLRELHPTRTTDRTP